MFFRMKMVDKLVWSGVANITLLSAAKNKTRAIHNETEHAMRSSKTVFFMIKNPKAFVV